LLAFPLSICAEGERFHTSPECWKEARIYHPGPPPAELANRVHLIETTSAAPAPGEPTVSPNGGYRFWVRNPDTSKEGPWGAGIIIDVERKTRPTLVFENVAQPIHPRWLSEKLVFVRVAWGRIAFSDLIFDVENREIVYHQEARYGQLAFEQYRQACGGRCPCDDDPGKVAPLPVSKAAPGVLIGLLEMPTIFGPGETGGVVQSETPRAVPVYAEPEQDAAVVARPIKPEEVEYREIGYEAGAAVVYEQGANWYRIGLAGQNQRRGWVKAADVGSFSAVAELLPSRLAYLNEHWNGELWSAPEAGAGVKRSRLKKEEGEQEYVVDVRETRQTDRGLWLKVALYEHNPCEGGQSDIAEEGWIPAYSSNGQLAAWYYSRGC
jgi:hypothetical protein